MKFNAVVAQRKEANRINAILSIVQAIPPLGVNWRTRMQDRDSTRRTILQKAVSVVVILVAVTNGLNSRPEEGSLLTEDFMDLD